MTPYTKKIVELHKIHKAIEEKDCCNGGGAKEITIDDVVKFIHNDLAGTPLESMFPYTTWDSIPNYDDVENNQICKSNDVGVNHFKSFILSTPSYTIGIKNGIS